MSLFSKKNGKFSQALKFQRINQTLDPPNYLTGKVDGPIRRKVAFQADPVWILSLDPVDWTLKGRSRICQEFHQLISMGWNRWGGNGFQKKIVPMFEFRFRVQSFTERPQITHGLQPCESEKDREKNSTAEPHQSKVLPQIGNSGFPISHGFRPRRRLCGYRCKSRPTGTAIALPHRTDQ